MPSTPTSTPKPRSSLFRGAALVILLVTTVAGCRTWTPAADLPEGPLPRTRVTMEDGEEVEIHDARLREDSVVVGERVDNEGRFTAPLSRIAGIEYGEVSVSRTVGLIALLGLGGFALLALTIDLSASPDGGALY